MMITQFFVFVCVSGVLAAPNNTSVNTTITEDEVAEISTVPEEVTNVTDATPLLIFSKHKFRPRTSAAGRAHDETEYAEIPVPFESMNVLNGINDDVSKLTPIGVLKSSSPLVYTYRLRKEDDGPTCILMSVDAMISFIYTTKLDQKDESDVFVPGKLDLSGDCSERDAQWLVLTWRGLELTFKFVKTPGGERWFVRNIKLQFNTKSGIFSYIKEPNLKVIASTKEEDIMFPTPMGSSYKCHKEIEINLMDPRYKDIRAKLLLRELTLQSFMLTDEFGPDYLCSFNGPGVFGSDAIAFFFGCVFMIAALTIIIGYWVHERYNAHKTAYSAMQ